MADINYEDTRLVIADRGGQIREEIRNIMRHEGFRDIDLVDSLAAVKEVVANDQVDLLITDHELPGGDTDKLIHQIRHHEIGSNPFIVIICLAQNPEKEDIMRIIDSGADDLVLKPITAGKLVKRVEFLTKQRKDFVVTASYIGPTRRSGGDREGAIKIPEFEVPNPVKQRALGQPIGSSFQKEIDKFSSIINEQKVERNAFQISFLVERIMPLYKDGIATTDTKKALDRLKYVTEDLSRRLKDSKYDHVSELCNTLLGVVSKICKKPKQPEPKDLKLLPNLAQAIDTAFAADGDDTSIARSIADSVQHRKD
jgi:DNA-binding response OmpR family regulator